MGERGCRRVVRVRAGRIALMAAILVGTTISVVAPSAGAAVPTGFSDGVFISGLSNPTAIQFASNGQIFVAQKGGQIYSFDSAGGSRTLFADLSTPVHDFWDRGLLGMALSPSYPSDPSVYVLYTYDAVPGGTAPRWNDGCPTPPGATTDGCVVTGRLSRLRANPTGPPTETVLIEGWCQQFPSHSVGTLRFGADGYLYASAGEGASFNNVDYGQYGNTYPSDQANPCGDPPASAGTPLTAPSAEGGALRSQSPLRTGGPTTLDGTIIRVDPATGAGVATNPDGSDADANKRRVLAFGLRNPFRFTTRPGTNELWIGDVGWNAWEEINRIPNTGAGTRTNFGWPCYEGGGPQPGYQSAGLTLCGQVTPTAPYYAYNHSNQVVSNDGCPTGGSSITGMAFYPGGSYPASYNGGLFFADHTRRCIWFMPAGTNGLPNAAAVQLFEVQAGNPVDLQTGPGGDIFYADLDGGAIHRIRYTATGNAPPTAVISAQPTSGPTPLTVNFDGSASRDPEGGALAYAWDLDGDGAFDDATSAQASWTYTTSGSITARLRVSDPQGATGTASVTITAGNSPPVPSITNPTSATRWKVGDTISFSGSATDAQDGTEPASRLSWALVLHHCFSATNCHVHTLGSFPGVASGSFVAPDHGYPVDLELQLTATDAGGSSATTSVRLDPLTVDLTFRTNPGGLKATITSADTTLTTPTTHTYVVNSTVHLIAPATVGKGSQSYNFQSWSDGGAADHSIVAPGTPTTYTATYRKR